MSDATTLTENSANGNAARRHPSPNPSLAGSYRPRSVLGITNGWRSFTCVSRAPIKCSNTVNRGRIGTTWSIMLSHWDGLAQVLLIDDDQGQQGAVPINAWDFSACWPN